MKKFGKEEETSEGYVKLDEGVSLEYLYLSTGKKIGYQRVGIELLNRVPTTASEVDRQV